MKTRWIYILILATFVLVGCGGTTNSTEISSTEISSTEISKPPVAGDWVATTDFGKSVFTVNDTGTKISKMIYQFSEWTCGPVTNSGTIEIKSTWSITNGKFIVESSFDAGKKQTMNFSGTYDASNQKFSGTWSAVYYGTKCSGTWEAMAP
jgi:hypothetical protein